MKCSTVKGNVAEYNNICLVSGKCEISLSSMPLKSCDRSLSASSKHRILQFSTLATEAGHKALSPLNSRVIMVLFSPSFFAVWIEMKESLSLVTMARTSPNVNFNSMLFKMLKVLNNQVSLFKN